MRLDEITQMIDEGPRQDRAAELFTELRPVFDAEGPREFRKQVMTALMQEFDCSIANAANIYNAQMKKAGIEGLSNAERRATAGKEPVKARVKGGALPDIAPATLAEPSASGEKSEEQDDAEVRALLHDTDKYDDVTDEDDIEWARDQDANGNLVVEWTYQYNRSSAVDAVRHNHDEVMSANSQLAGLGQKYRDRVVAYRPASLERAVKDDEMFKGKPDTVRRLRGQIVFKL